MRPMRQSPSLTPRAIHGTLRMLLAPLVCVVAALALAGCAVHPGQDEIAFLRGGALIALNPDGSDARTLASGSIVSFAWSPDHSQLVFRTAVGSDVADLLPYGTMGVPDAAGTLQIIGINGGHSIQITPDATGVIWSDAWWNANGNRLLYREALAGTDPEAGAQIYVVSQSDQPAGIARQTVMNDASLPALAPDGSRVAGIDGVGTLSLAVPGKSGQALASGALLTLPGTGRPGRVLWQPGHNALLYDHRASGQTRR